MWIKDESWCFHGVRRIRVKSIKFQTVINIALSSEQFLLLNPSCHGWLEEAGVIQLELGIDQGGEMPPCICDVGYFCAWASVRVRAARESREQFLVSLR